VLSPEPLPCSVCVRVAWPVAVAALALWLGACAGPTPERPATFTFRVPQGQTFDLTRGQVLPPEALPGRLAQVRLLFLGENHTDPRSHAFQREVLEALVAAGRQVTVALEMFSPAADAALEDWRQGRLDELAFLERSDWYAAWGFAWDYYQGVFETIRRHRLPVRGVNADRETRNAVRRGEVEGLPADLRAEIGDLDDAPLAHRDYLLDALHRSGHAGDLAPESAGFRGFHRVQTLWDRLMGNRAARLIEPDNPQAIVVVLIGSGHVAYKLGANLQAARVSPAPQLSLWDGPAGAHGVDGDGRALVPVGLADLVRVYPEPEEHAAPPTLGGVKLEAAPGGVRVQSVSHFAPRALRALQADDLIVALNGRPAGSPTALRLAYERTPPDETPRLEVRRGERTLTVGGEAESP